MMSMPAGPETLPETAPKLRVDDLSVYYGPVQAIKHASVWEVDPFSFEFGLSGANQVLTWTR